MDRDYCLRRAAEERGKAEAAECPEARKAHLEMAEQFERKAAVLGGGEKPELKLVGR